MLLYDVYKEVVLLDKEILKGSIDILLLSIIAKRDTYGYEIAQSLKDASEDLYSMGQGTLYPALKRLEKKEFLESYWNQSENGMKRKFYTITSKGKKELQKKVNSWERVTSLIQTCQKGVIYE
jgi:PadR family transcriptional regulator, regulatory protein PadR